jgi:hypothetical protein
MRLLRVRSLDNHLLIALSLAPATGRERCCRNSQKFTTPHETSLVVTTPESTPAGKNT